MSKIVRFSYVFTLGLLLSLAAGCSSPVFTRIYPTDPTTGAQLTNKSPVAVIVSTETQGTLAGIKAAADSIPSPVSPFVAIGTTLASLVLAEIARRKTTQLKDSQLSLNAVVTGIELTGHQATKDSIARIAIATGAESNLAPTVQNVQDRLATLRTAPIAPTA